MAFWVNITDSEIAAGAPPTSDLANVFRERDICNATKPAGVQVDGSYTQLTTIETDVTCGDYKIFVPDDCPAGFQFFMPLHYDATTWGGQVWIKLGTNESPRFSAAAGTYGFTVLAVDVDTSLRGTEVSLYLMAWSDYYDVDPLTVFKVKGAGAATQALASFRRKPAVSQSYTINIT